MTDEIEEKLQDLTKNQLNVNQDSDIGRSMTSLKRIVKQFVPTLNEVTRSKQPAIANIELQSDNSPTISHLLSKQMNSVTVDLHNNELHGSCNVVNEKYIEAIENIKVVEFISSEATAKRKQNVHVCNNMIALM
ncbi:unnamed protein product [Adineta ricciae]|uniref:Uncharacterized protein n=1 Tax=Adineta ricciae TaxID=249248 RepID=A0A816FBU9_ADIRI|nr:unnamed protein product [Adineta ricciae]CAF1659580.1 unnamed protein product [Adineta ricciae]